MATELIPADLAAELGTIREMAAQITDDHTVADCSADLGVRCTGHDAERMADAIEAALKVAAQYENGCTRWAEPLPVPTWIPRLREAMGAALAGEPEPEWLKYSHPVIGVVGEVPSDGN